MEVDEDHADRISRLFGRGLDWDRLVLLARRHGLVPLLHRTLSGLKSNGVPPDVRQRLRSLAEGVRFHGLVLLRELLNALRALESAGITAVPYKGPALAAFLYRDLALRQFSDIDLLVRPRDAVKARRVLLDLGYVPRRPMSERAAAAYARLHCDFTFTADGQLNVDLTWWIAPRYWRLPEIPRSSWDRLGRLSLGGVSVPWLAPRDLLFVLCIHGCKHKWDTLKWIVDIAEWLRNHPDFDWREAMHDARQAGYERMLALSVFLAHELLEAPLPAAVLEAVRSKPRVADLAAEVCENLFAAYSEPASTLVQLPFLARLAERFDTKLSCQLLRPLYFLLHRVARPGMAALRKVAAG